MSQSDFGGRTPKDKNGGDEDLLLKYDDGRTEELKVKRYGDTRSIHVTGIRCVAFA